MLQQAARSLRIEYAEVMGALLGKVVTALARWLVWRVSALQRPGTQADRLVPCSLSFTLDLRFERKDCDGRR